MILTTLTLFSVPEAGAWRSQLYLFLRDALFAAVVSGTVARLCGII